MIIVLMEDRVHTIKSLPAMVRARFPKTSVMTVNKNNRVESLELSKTTPLLTDGWAIIINQGVNLDQALPFFNNTKNSVIYWIKPSEKSDVINRLNELKFKFTFVDNINVSREELIDYVSNKLELKKADAKTLCNKCNNYLPYVLESTALLSSLGRKVTRKDILKFIDKHNRVSIHSLFLHLIGYKVMETSLVSSYLYDFRFGFHYVKENLLKYLNDAIKVYLLIEQGFLGADNYSTYVFDSKLTISDYVLKNLILNVHPKVSLEVLLLAKIKVQKSSLHDLLNYI